MTLRDRLLYACLAGILGGVLGAAIVLVGFARIVRDTHGADPGAMLRHWTWWSAVLFAAVGLWRGDRAADTLGDVLTAFLRLSFKPSSISGLRREIWPVLWVGVGYFLIWQSRPGT